MNNAECLEVAEKVWKWSRKDQYDFYGKQALKVGLAVSNDYKDIAFEIQKEVDSWPGFGRTVSELRTMQTHLISIDLGWHLDAGTWACNLQIDEYRYNGFGLSPIEATHLAALKAVKNDKD